MLGPDMQNDKIVSQSKCTHVVTKKLLELEMEL